MTRIHFAPISSASSLHARPQGQAEIPAPCPFDCLLVDDDPVVLMIHDHLIRQGRIHPHPLTYADGQQAWDYLQGREEIPSLIFLDINMPVMDGWEFLDKVTAAGLTTQLYVYITSSSADPRDQAKASAYPSVVGYLEKPLLMAKIEQIRVDPCVRFLFDIVGERADR